MLFRPLRKNGVQMLSDSDVPTRLLSLLNSRKETMACAESFTGGALTARLIEPEGASSVFIGGLIAYATRIKSEQLGVDPELIAKFGTVNSRVAIEMAHGAIALFNSDWALATTGVAGPEYHEGHRPGTLFIALAARNAAKESTWVEKHVIDGTRIEVRNEGVRLALNLAKNVISSAGTKSA